MKVSLNRQQVESALEERNTTLPAFIEERREQGKSYEEIAFDLRITTGVPFSNMSLYRWAKRLERVA